MITAAQAIARKSYAGSSDAAPIMGLDPFRSASDVFLEKTGQVDPFAGNEHTERGVVLEPVLLTWAAKQLGIPIDRDVMEVDASGLLCVNFDAITPDRKASIEAKTVANADEWGAANTDEVPDRVIVQAHHGFAIVPTLEVCWVPVLMPGYRTLDLKLYRVERNDELADHVAETGRHFMRHHVKLGIPPDDFKPSMETLKRMRREPGKVVLVADELVDRVLVCRAAAARAREDAEAAEAALLTDLGDADGGTFSRGRVTYMETKRRGYAVEATTYRTLRIKRETEQ